MEFSGYNARVTYDGETVKAIRQEADKETLASAEKLSTKQKILGIDASKAKITQVYSHLGIVTDPNETSFKVTTASDPRPNLVLIEKSGWKEALKVIERIQADLAAGKELYFLNVDPSELPAPKLDKHSASPEWADAARETKDALELTPVEGWITFSITAPEYPNGLGFQGMFNGPEKFHLELFDSEDPPYGPEVRAALRKAGWSDPTEDIPLYTIEVAWSEKEAQNIANFMMNTLQWCLFLDASTVSIASEITEDK